MEGDNYSGRSEYAKILTKLMVENSNGITIDSLYTDIRENYGEILELIVIIIRYDSLVFGQGHKYYYEYYGTTQLDRLMDIVFSKGLGNIRPLLKLIEIIGTFLTLIDRHGDRLFHTVLRRSIEDLDATYSAESGNVKVFLNRMCQETLGIIE
jgi:hypothetical protein